jgi:hypothetical protein
MVDVEAGVYSIRVETFSGVLKTGAIPKMEILSGMLPAEIIIHVSPIK